jgi:basic membrane protein A
MKLLGVVSRFSAFHSLGSLGLSPNTLIKKSRFLLIFLALLLYGPIAPVQGESQTDISGMKLALILGGSAKDGSWNEAGAEGVTGLESLGVEVVIAEQIPDPDAERVIRQYAEQGFDLIIGHSFSHQDAIFTVADEFPDINFAWAAGIGRFSENVSDYDQPFFEAAYLAGILAGDLTNTGKLGALYGFEIPVCKAMGNAFLSGAQLVNPDATLTDVAVGDWYDVGRAKEAALAQAETGVDFWIGCGQGPTWGSIEAAKEVDGFGIGYVRDMTVIGPEVVVASIVWNTEPLFRQMLMDIKMDDYSNKYYALGVSEDVIQLSINPSFQDQIDPETITLYEETKAKIISGEIEVPFQPD